VPDTRSKNLTREKFVRELLKGRGINEIFRDHGYKSASVYYKWKTKYPDFKEQCEKILAGPIHRARISAAQTPKINEGSWREQYINKFRETRSRTLAADFCGKTVTEILAACDPLHDSFDEEFFNLVRDEELRDAVTVEDELKRKAVVENSVGMQKWILPFLPVVGEKYYKGAENRLKQAEQKNVNIFFGAEGVSGAKKLLEDMFGREEKEIVI
jgi:hypothetical protein